MSDTQEENRSKRMQFLIKPSTNDELDRLVEQGIITSKNDLINRLLEDYVEQETDPIKKSRQYIQEAIDMAADSYQLVYGEASESIEAFAHRQFKEDIVELYVEYYNLVADLSYDNSEEAKKLKRQLDFILDTCSESIIRQVLKEKGYTSHLLSKYYKR